MPLACAPMSDDLFRPSRGDDPVPEDGLLIETVETGGSTALAELVGGDTSGPSSARSIIPELPTWRHTTVPVSSHAARTGSHQPEWIDG